MRFAYADLPYPGQAHKLYHDNEVNHRLLIAYLQEFDGWALSTASTTLQYVLELCPRDVRIAAWVKPFAIFKPNVNPAYTWEPVIWKSPRKHTREEPTVKDHVIANVTLRKGLCGAKPEIFCKWLLELLGVQVGDTLEDVFPGTGTMSQVFDILLT